ncbi:MAG: heparinase II/III family protein [Armatimonadota bacterium]|nr:heparinase II/III family protein [Armatimonadota bacterium]
MFGKARIVILALAVFVVSTATVSAGPELDRVLDYMFMDQSVPMRGPQLLFDVQREIQLTADTRIGQTFVTGPNTARLARVRAYLAPTADWTPGEGAELTLWDSPARTKRLGSSVVTYEDRVFHYNQVEWDLNVDVKPNTTYYFELTYTGSGDGKLGRVGVMNGRDAYRYGQGYLNGQEADFDICFQTHSRRAYDPVRNLKEMFSRLNLELPGFRKVKAAVEKGDFETAIRETVAYFEARKEPCAIINPSQTPKRDPNFDLTKANEMLNKDWRHADLEGYEGRKILINAYNATGDDKYIKKLNDLLIDWYVHRPPPSKSKIGGHPWDDTWSSLSTGLRIGHGFVAYSWMSRSPAFSTDCRMAYIIGLADHCNTLVEYGADAGGNWAFTQNCAMLTFAMNFPEFKESEVWKQTAIERLAASIKRDILPDGVETESAPSYQRMAYNPLATGVYDELIVKRGLKTPFAKELRDILERQAEYFMYIAMPNGVTPYLGDWAHENQRPAILADAKRFNRKDMLYVATAGKEGVKPKELSKLYPCAGIVTMRSDWGDKGRPFEDARYLTLHGVHFGAHGHQDLNGIAGLYAYGRELLYDPGSHIYGSPEHFKLTTAISHNLMTIDGEDQNRSAKAEFKNWCTTPVVDYVSSWVDAYKGGDYTREIFYIRANGDPGIWDYWLVRDTANGSGEHSLEQRWRFVYETPVETDEKSLLTKTSHQSGGNLAIVQIAPFEGMKLERTTTDVWLWRNELDTAPCQIPTVNYVVRRSLPAAIDTLLLPFDEQNMPTLSTRTLERSSDGLDTAFTIEQGRVEDLFVYQRAPRFKNIPEKGIAFNGERLFVRRVGGKLRSALLVNGSQLIVDGKRVISAAKPLSWVAVTFDGSKVKAYSSSEEKSLVVSWESQRKITVQNAGTDKLLRMCN